MHADLMDTVLRKTREASPKLAWSKSFQPIVLIIMYLSSCSKGIFPASITGELEKQSHESYMRFKFMMSGHILSARMFILNWFDTITMVQVRAETMKNSIYLKRSHTTIKMARGIFIKFELKSDQHLRIMIAN